jgi:hypothetical protein
MARARARMAVLQDIAMHMLEKGHVMTRHEWEKDPKAPIRIGMIFNLFGNWPRMVGILENELPDAWKQINEKPEPAPAPKPKAEPKPAPKPKADALEALSKAAKAEKSDD